MENTGHRQDDLRQDGLRSTFEGYASPAAQQTPKRRKRKKTPPPFSLRLTPEERAELEKQAAGMSLGAYIRLRLFDDALPVRRTRGKAPVKDHEELGRVLGALGQSRIANNLNQLAKAVHTGALPVTEEVEAALHEACYDIRLMRQALLRGLGLPEPGP